MVIHHVIISENFERFMQLFSTNKPDIESYICLFYPKFLRLLLSDPRSNY